MVVRRWLLFQLGLEGFELFNDAPAYLSGRVETIPADGARIHGRVNRHSHAWYNMGARSRPLMPESLVFAVQATAQRQLGAWSLGVQAVERGLSLNVGHFVRSSVVLHEPRLARNVISAWGYDEAGVRSQNATANALDPAQVQHLEVRYDTTDRELTASANGLRVHTIRGNLRPFRLLLRFQAVGVEGEFDVDFSNLTYGAADPVRIENIHALGAWDAQYAPVFVSYAHRDAERVRSIVAALRARAVRVLGDWDFATGDSLEARIRSSVDRAGYLVVIVSHASLASEWVNRELRLALADEAALGRVKVLPFVIEDCELPAFLGDRLWADGRTPDADGLQRLLDVIRRSATW